MAEVMTGDRRPIASRERPVFQRLAARLARAGTSANAISIFGMLAGISAGALLVATRFTDGIATHVCFLLAAGGIQLRLLANMLDGMVAIASGKASQVGELYNEIPDRISDTAILVGAGYAAGGDPTLGWAAASVALFVTYIRAVGKTVGVPGLFQGPMSKSHRMFTLTVASVCLGLLPEAWQPMWTSPGFNSPVGIMAATLALVIVGGILTAWRRLRRIVRAMRERP